MRTKEFRTIFRNAQKLKQVYRLFEFYRETLLRATNRMNLAKVHLANQILKLLVYAEIFPALSMTARYSRLTDLASVFARDEDQDFNREFFGDALVPDNFRALRTEHDNPIFAWVDQYVPLSPEDKQQICRKHDLKSQAEMQRVRRHVDKRLAHFDQAGSTLNADFGHFESRLAQQLQGPTNMLEALGPDAQTRGDFNALPARAGLLHLSAQNEQIIEPNSGSTNQISATAPTSGRRRSSRSRCLSSSVKSSKRPWPSPRACRWSRDRP